MTTKELYGLEDTQHRDVGRLVKASRTTRRPGVVVPSGGVYPGAARVMLLGSDPPTYNPREPRDVALFRRNVAGSQITVDMIGTNLQGDLVVSIDGVEYQIPCDAKTAAIRAIVGLPLQDCRITAFYGYWEFDFNQGRWANGVPSFSVMPWEAPEGDTETPVFDAGLIVTTEGWVSVTDDGDTFQTIQVNDWKPFYVGFYGGIEDRLDANQEFGPAVQVTSAITSGSLGLAHWSHEAGWLVSEWQQRLVSFAGETY